MMERNKNRIPLRGLGLSVCRRCSPTGMLRDGEHAMLGSWGRGSALPQMAFSAFGEGILFFSTDRIVTEQQQEACYGCFLSTQWEELLLSFAALCTQCGSKEKFLFSCQNCSAKSRNDSFVHNSGCWGHQG